MKKEDLTNRRTRPSYLMKP